MVKLLGPLEEKQGSIPPYAEMHQIFHGGKWQRSHSAPSFTMVNHHWLHNSTDDVIVSALIESNATLLGGRVKSTHCHVVHCVSASDA